MRPRIMQAMLVALATLVVSFAGPGVAEGQMLVVAERDLDFGMLTPGLETVVVPTDLMRSAQLRIEGRGSYQLSFQLPASLTAPGGAQIPLQFGAADGQLVIRHKVTAFDPNSTVSFRVNPAEREAQVNLGGRARPGPSQPAGVYTATIVMMVVQTGT
jgi:hypothetical protein